VPKSVSAPTTRSSKYFIAPA